ncbi:MAG: hypoxanthine phosphoribosyltransferase [Chloroflexi bacterium]|nr:hypoxanthine phosphoribosyltransferase [Ardenticatenaceae bacterium]MBL1129855.1 hypoxanthine phosphoribosyltransferase [Chloroflexota bacterium]NOG35940.1 hypoxanthine phosphoribosyltransferase [Chloroflexota bacterium]GIK56221.1 MAG: hypoxanthine phosphoribosyltransferase [Chloroflexota bacterium]
MTNQLHPDLTRILVSEVTIQQHVFDLAQKISADYAHVKRLYVVGVLKGAFIFLADLCRQLTIPHVVDFMALSSYGKAGAVSGAVRLVMDLREPIEGEHVLIVEDIVDKGLTLHYLVEALQGRQPASLKTCALVRKKRHHEAISVDYLGFEIPDVWVVGYGLDYAERFRTLPYIAELNPSVYKA